MKRFGILVLLLISLSLFSYGAFAAANVGLPAKVSLSVESGDDKAVSFVINNTGDVNLTNLKVSVDGIDLVDNDDNEIDLETRTTKTSLNVNETATGTISVDVESDYEIGEQTGTITVTTDQGSFTTNFELNIKPLVCEMGVQGNDLEVSIDDPDSDEEFEPGEEVAVTINVENTGNDDKSVVVEAILYDVDDGKKIDSYKSSRKKIDEDEDLDFEFKLQISDTYDTDNELQLFVKVYEYNDEENECVEDEQDLDIVEVEDKVSIRSVSLLPSTASCGSTVDAAVSLLNIGSNDQSVVVTVTNTQLGISSSATANLGTDSDDKTEVVSPSFKVPANAKEGQYSLLVTASYSGLKTVSEQVLNVFCTQQTTTTVTTPVTTGNNIVPSTTTYTPKSSMDYFDLSDGIPMSVWILVDVLLVAGIVALLVLIFRRRH